MALRSRRRNALSIPSLFAALFLLASTAAAASAVLGIDMGTEYMKAVLVKPGLPLEIVLSKDSKRREASALSFKPVGLARGAKRLDAGVYPERSYGGDALALGARFPGDVYPNLKKLLGLQADGTVAQSYSKSFPALELVPASKDRNTVGFKSQGFHQDEPAFAVEELLAMQLKNVRENAQTLAGKSHKVQSTVITVPAFYTAEERKALTLAAELAGLKVLGLVSDGLAVGINYATNRNFPVITKGEKPEHHLIFDVGAGSTKATVLRMNGRSVKDIGKFNKTVEEVTVLGVGWDRTLGGDALNQVIVDDMIESFIASAAAKSLGSSAEGVRQNGRAGSRLWRDAEKVRQVLSANQETGASFEELHGDADFRYKLSRTAFEEKAAPFADRLEAPIKQALRAANVTMEELDSVIMYGGAARTPFIAKRVESLVGASKIRTNVNADEAAVFGAAFKAARLSPSFRVKEIRDADLAGYATWLTWRAEGKEKSQKLFLPTSSIAVPKEVPFTNMDDFTFHLYQSMGTEDTAAPPNSGASITIITTNLTASVKQLVETHGCKQENISHSWTMRLDPTFGLPEVVEGTVSCEVDLTADKKDKDTAADTAKGWFGFGGKKGEGEQEPLAEGAEDAASSSTSSASAEDSKATDAAKDTKPKKAKAPAKPKKKIEIIRIAFESQDNKKGVDSTEVKRMKDRLVAFDASDKARRTREEDLNNLESFTYKVRDYLTNDAFMSYLPETVQKTLETLQEETSSWLSEDGSKATSEILKEKLKGLKEIVSPALKRQQEALSRPDAVKALQQAMNQTESMLSAVKEALADQEKAAEEALASAAKAATEVAADAVSSASSAIVGESTGSSDPLADLEEDDLPAASTTSSAASTSGTPVSILNPYTDTDLTDLSTVYDNVKTWLANKLDEQDLLPAFENPLFDTAELEKKSKELNDAVMSLITRRLKSGFKGGKAGGGSSSTKSKTKSSSSKAAKSSAKKGKSSASAEPSMASKVVELEVEVPEDGTTAEYQVRDEL